MYSSVMATHTSYEDLIRAVWPAQPRSPAEATAVGPLGGWRRAARTDEGQQCTMAGGPHDLVLALVLRCQCMGEVMKIMEQAGYHTQFL